IGIALSVLLVARVLYRFYEIATTPLPRGGAGMQDFARSPLTLVVLGMLASYYAAYAVGVLLHRHRVRQVPGLVDVGAAKDGRARSPAAWGRPPGRSDNGCHARGRARGGASRTAPTSRGAGLLSAMRD